MCRAAAQGRIYVLCSSSGEKINAFPQLGEGNICQTAAHCMGNICHGCSGGRGRTAAYAMQLFGGERGAQGGYVMQLLGGEKAAYIFEMLCLEVLSSFCSNSSFTEFSSSASGGQL